MKLESILNYSPDEKPVQIPDDLQYSNKEYLKRENKNKAITKRKILAEFIHQNNLFVELTVVNEQKILIVSDSDLGNSLNAFLKKLSKQSRVLEGKKIYNHCFHVAQAACLDEKFSGILREIEDSSSDHKLIEAAFHFINFHQVSENLFVAFDLTTRRNIDHYQGEFDVLLIVADSMENLEHRLKQLYGSNWQEVEVGEEYKYTKQYRQKKQFFPFISKITDLLRGN